MLQIHRKRLANSGKQSLVPWSCAVHYLHDEKKKEWGWGVPGEANAWNSSKGEATGTGMRKYLSMWRALNVEESGMGQTTEQGGKEL